MAKLQSETIKITVSKLLKDTDKEDILLTAETMASLEVVIQELAGAGTLIEIDVE
jgi:translation initiation factor IF-2